MTGPPRELLEFLCRYDPGIQSLAFGLRKVVHEEMAHLMSRMLPTAWPAKDAETKSSTTEDRTRTESTD